MNRPIPREALTTAAQALRDLAEQSERMQCAALMVTAYSALAELEEAEQFDRGNQS